jgi:hypothetical protein
MDARVPGRSRSLGTSDPRCWGWVQSGLGGAFGANSGVKASRARV